MSTETDPPHDPIYAAVYGAALAARLLQASPGWAATSLDTKRMSVKYAQEWAREVADLDRTMRAERATWDKLMGTEKTP